MVSKQVEAERSITRKGRGITVAPSPLNKVKFELGVVLVLLPLSWLLVSRLFASSLVQFVVLFGLAGMASVWLVLRTRSTLRKRESEQQEQDGGTQQK